MTEVVRVWCAVGDGCLLFDTYVPGRMEGVFFFPVDPLDFHARCRAFGLTDYEIRDGLARARRAAFKIVRSEPRAGDTSRRIWRRS